MMVQNLYPNINPIYCLQKNPWAITSRQAVPVIQIIWDHLFADIPQEIMTTSVIYHLVCIFF